MSVDAWVSLASGIALMIVGAMLKHVVTDARRAQRLKSLENRVKKLDGIDANGD